MKRGEVRWYTFELPDKRRPVLVLTRSSATRFLNAISVAPITSTVRDIPSEVFLSREDGLFTDCAVNLDHIQTIPKAQVRELIAVLSSHKMLEVQQAISFALGFDEMYLSVQESI